MSYPITLSQGWSTMAEEIDAEIARARKKFPRPDYLVTALTEEHGEAVRAVLEYLHEPTVQRLADVRKELIQTAAMCIRLAQEGDPKHQLPGALTADDSTECRPPLVTNLMEALKASIGGGK